MILNAQAPARTCAQAHGKASLGIPRRTCRLRCSSVMAARVEGCACALSVCHSAVACSKRGRAAILGEACYAPHCSVRQTTSRMQPRVFGSRASIPPAFCQPRAPSVSASASASAQKQRQVCARCYRQPARAEAPAAAAIRWVAPGVRSRSRQRRRRAPRPMVSWARGVAEEEAASAPVRGRGGAARKKNERTPRERAAIQKAEIARAIRGRWG